jgi:hypothetical protein
MEEFVYKGWQGDASANAVAGVAGANTNASFTQGVVIYQLTESGLMLKADVSGTKYWMDKKLNQVQPGQTAYTTSATPVVPPAIGGSVDSEELSPND